MKPDIRQYKKGGGSPAPACIYGRVGWCSRRRRSGGVGAAGGRFGVGVTFSGGGVLRGSSSSRWTGRSSRPGAVLEFGCLPSDPWWRRIRWLEFRSRRGWRLLPASGTKMTAARWRCWCGRVLAVLVHRLNLRRCAAGGLGGFLQRWRHPGAVVRRRSVVFVVAAGEVAGVCSSSVPLRMYFCTLFVLCTLYMVLC